LQHTNKTAGQAFPLKNSDYIDHLFPEQQRPDNASWRLSFQRNLLLFGGQGYDNSAPLGCQVPLDTRKAVLSVLEGLVPEKSKLIYNQVYSQFEKWLTGNGTNHISEHTLL